MEWTNRCPPPTPSHHPVEHFGPINYTKKKKTVTITLNNVSAYYNTNSMKNILGRYNEKHEANTVGQLTWYVIVGMLLYFSTNGSISKNLIQIVPLRTLEDSNAKS